MDCFFGKYFSDGQLEELLDFQAFTWSHMGRNPDTTLICFCLFFILGSGGTYSHTASDQSGCTAV